MPKTPLPRYVRRHAQNVYRPTRRHRKSVARATKMLIRRFGRSPVLIAVIRRQRDVVRSTTAEAQRRRENT